MSDRELVGSTPYPSYVQIVAGLVRGILQLASGFGFTWALTVSGDQATMIATAIVGVVTLGWSAWQKFSAARQLHMAALASARKRIPVEPATQPPPP